MTSGASRPSPLAKKRQVLRVDIGDHRAALDAHCAGSRVTISQFVRSTLLAAMSSADPSAAVLPAGRSQGGRPANASVIRKAPSGRRGRRELRLSPQEDAVLMERAELAGFTFQGYVTALVRAHLTGHAQFGKPELLALQDSTLQLVDLAQMLRRSPGPISASIERTITAHLKALRTLIEKNEARWL